MVGEDPEIQHLLDIWVEEFSRAVGMFSGQAPEVHHNSCIAIPTPGSEAVLWMRQGFADGGEFAIWFGGQEPGWTKLGSLLGEGSPEATRSTYLEIINQAHQGFAGAINSNFAKTLSCEQPELFDKAGFEAIQFAIFEVELVEPETPPFYLALEYAAIKVLDGHASGQLSDPAHTEGDPVSALASLLPLKLGVSVSLGHSELELKKAMQAGPRSIIVLNKDVTEPAALLIQGRVVAQGEVVLVKGNFGFRVKQIVSRQDRLGMLTSELAIEE